MTSKRKKVLREGAPVYRTAKTADTASLADALWMIIQALSEDDRAELFSRMLQDQEWREDLYDAILIIESRGEPTRPYQEIREELVREGLL